MHFSPADQLSQISNDASNPPTAVKLKKLMYDASLSIDDYYVIMGAELKITCTMESNVQVPDSKVMRRQPFLKGVSQKCSCF